ncbi:MAG: asparagine synthase (glutamine-hydrolyzing) [Candidatus Babeliales bacterium]|nr:asparagine synthase (glutamine-hydrolyzing) [Candidatus Babeliales bacterium]
MCGLAGYLNLSSSQFSLDDSLLYKLQKSLIHRGPDGFGVWKSAPHEIALVHRRLSIVDLSVAAAQPMLDREQSVVISYNGEIYNHAALRKELEALGYRYSSNSDTETLIYAYKQWGINFIDRLEGMFAIALFDIQKNELYLIRDRIGVKPLYFSLQGSILSFASEIKALWQLPWNEKKIKQSAVSHYLTYLATPAPSTLYEEIYKLPPSFYLKVDTAKNVTFHEWYTPIKSLSLTDAQAFQDEQYCIDGVRRLLREAVKKRMMADVPFGVFLSGGIDSSLNVALMAEFTDQVKTFTVAFSDGPEYDELPWARKIATQFNTDHHEIMITEKDAFNFFQKMVYHQDEPLADCVCAPLYFVSKLLKDSGVTVVQVGEGSDEIFCGYATYARYLDVYNRYWQPSQKYVPAFAKKAIYQVASRYMPHNYNKLDVIKNWTEDKHMFWSGATAFSQLWKQQIVANGMSAVANDPIIEAIYPGLQLNGSSYELIDYHLKKLKQLSPDADFLTSMIYLELKQRLPELLLMRVDKMSMATSVEARVPFLDHALVEFAMHIPARFKYNNGVTKSILKKAAQGIIPDDVIYRKKMGFAAPTKRWFKTGDYFKPYMHDLLASNQQAWGDYLHMPNIERMLIDNQKNNVDYSVQLWAIQNLLACEGV